jgi:hypothetical protein
LLGRVVRYELPLSDTLVMLRAFGWDAEAELYELTAGDVRAILGRYLTGDLTAAQLENWAELLEMRGDLGYEPEKTDTLKHIILRLANPETHGPITGEVALALQALLEVGDS